MIGRSSTPRLLDRSLTSLEYWIVRSSRTTTMESVVRSSTRLWLIRLQSKQRWHLPDLERSEKHRAVDEAQREGPRLLAVQHRFLAERIEAGDDAGIGVLFYNPAEAGDRAVER